MDTMVVGGGPVGCVAALALHNAGAKVQVFEAQPRAGRRFMGELLHPSAVAVLKGLGVDVAISGAQPNRGFAILSGGQWHRLEVAGDTGLTVAHEALIHRLREAVQDQGIALHMGSRIRREPSGAYRVQGGEALPDVDLVVAADGKFSALAKSVGGMADKSRLSHMIGLELRGATLPYEGFGHVMLGGLGPALAYRIDTDCVRICLDVPPRLRTDPRVLEKVWAGYEAVLPDPLRGPIQEALLARKVQWAVNGVRPRTTYGEAGLALVGDAVGYYHPMTAVGMSLGFADAQTLAAVQGDLTAYQARREKAAHVPSLLATALYEIFALDTAPTAACRQAIFDMWATSPAMRQRTMRLLGCQDTRFRALMRAGVPMITGALRNVKRQPGIGGSRDLARLCHWLLWDAVPESLQFPVLKRPQITPFEHLRLAVL